MQTIGNSRWTKNSYILNKNNFKHSCLVRELPFMRMCGGAHSCHTGGQMALTARVMSDMHLLATDKGNSLPLLSPCAWQVNFDPAQLSGHRCIPWQPIHKQPVCATNEHRETSRHAGSERSNKIHQVLRLHQAPHVVAFGDVPAQRSGPLVKRPYFAGNWGMHNLRHLIGIDRCNTLPAMQDALFDCSCRTSTLVSLGGQVTRNTGIWCACRVLPGTLPPVHMMGNHCRWRAC